MQTQNIEDLEPLSEEDYFDSTDEIEEEPKHRNKEHADVLTMFMREMSKYKLLTKDEEIKYSKLAQQGDIKARDKLINCNLRLVVNIAKKYCNRGSEFIDLIQEGVIGLMSAVRKFDPDRGFRFTTYAHHWIFEAITRAILDKGRTIRIPSNLLITINRLHSEIGKNKDLEKEKIAEKLKINPEKIEEYIEIRRDVISYDEKINDEGQSCLDFIEGEGQNIEETMFHQQFSNNISALLEKLSNKQKKIIVSRFGLFGEIPKTLEEIGKSMNMSRERVRQLESRALEKLRSSHFIVSVS